MKKTLIPVFPGTNCEQETLFWVQDNLESDVQFLSLEESAKLASCDLDAIVIPGGFSYGDYLRAGALAARSAQMVFVKKMALEGVAVLGICNGFQILCESGLLPGALVPNETRRHHHFPASIRFNLDFFQVGSQKECVWIPKLNLEKIPDMAKKYSNFLLPISCGMGKWIPSQKARTANEMHDVGVVVTYCKNENGSFQSIAGISNAKGNILGLMPHPERASSTLVGSVEGLLFLFGLSQNKNIKIKTGSELDLFSKSFLK